MCRGSWLVEEGQGMPFPTVKRKSKIAVATFDLRAYVKELILAVTLGIGLFSLYTVVFLWALELGEPTEFDRYVDEAGVWCREHMPDAKSGECFDQTGY